ncbi:MAG: amino acid racemase [Patescibacteria group bacterium]|nr:amino acid racemase [Patescibacteria group bacterium]
MEKHKKVGIIGGVGPQSTNFIYEKIIELSQLKYGAQNNADYPSLIIESVPVPDFISDTQNIETAERMLTDTARALVTAGATRLCIGSNTVHILLEKLRTQTKVPFISMIELVAQKCIERGFTKVGVLGTPVLIGSGLYPAELEKNGIAAILPTAEQMKPIEKIIRGVIAGSHTQPDKQAYIAVLDAMFAQGADAIILGCTELPLAVNYEALGARALNSDAILAEGIVDYYYAP